MRQVFRKLRFSMIDNIKNTAIFFVSGFFIIIFFSPLRVRPPSFAHLLRVALFCLALANTESMGK